MTRPLRIEFAGAVYHVTSRGDRREQIFDDDEDRSAFLAILGQGCERFDAAVLAYCLMRNHYHLVLTTRRANLSALMRHLNGIYTQRSNRRHERTGHVFEGRFQAILVDRDAYLLEVSRYVELNPVRAGLARRPADWPWSSYLAHTGQREAPVWLDTAWVAGVMLGRAPESAADQRRAARLYADLAESAPDIKPWSTALRQQIYLGDEHFVRQMQSRASTRAATIQDVPRAQRSPPPRRLTEWLRDCPSREESLARAHREGGMTMSALARELGLSVARVSQLIAKWEQRTST